MNKHNVIPYITYFGASWCGPCQSFKPQMLNVLSEYDNIELDEFPMETQSDTQAANEIFGVTNIPTVIVGFWAQSYDDNPNGYVLFPSSGNLVNPSLNKLRSEINSVLNIITADGGDYDKITARYSTTPGDGGNNNGNGDNGNTNNGGGGLLGIFNGSFDLFGVKVPNLLALLAGAVVVKKATEKDD